MPHLPAVAAGRDRLAVAAAALVEVVEEPRQRAHFLLQHVHPLVLQDVGHLAVRDRARCRTCASRSGRLPGTPASGRRACGAGRTCTSPSRPSAAAGWTGSDMSGLSCSVGNLRLGEVEPPRPVGAGRFAVPAADAPVVVDHRDAVRLLPGGLHRADLHARRLGALVALHRHVVLVRIRAPAAGRSGGPRSPRRCCPSPSPARGCTGSPGPATGCSPSRRRARSGGSRCSG